MKEQIFFYTATPVWKHVSEDEFMEFINKYPRKLRFDCCGISEPPFCSYNDFELANRWPYSVVAKYHAGEPNAYYGWDYKRDYQIMPNYEAVFESKTGNHAEGNE